MKNSSVLLLKYSALAYFLYLRERQLKCMKESVLTGEEVETELVLLVIGTPNIREKPSQCL